MVNPSQTDENLILDYLVTQNRPYGGTDIFNNLHGKVGKANVAKILTSLYERGIISGKANGKQWVYASKHVVNVLIL